MTIDLMSRIPDREDFDTHEKIVLLIMADRADEDGILWYANETIARKCSMSKRGVQKVLERLIARRVVRKMHRHDRSNFYILNVEALPHVAPPPKLAKERGPVEFLVEDEDPDLFGDPLPGGKIRGAPDSPRKKIRGEPGSIRGEPGSDRGEPHSPYSLSDSLKDPESPLAREIGDHLQSEWNSRLAAIYPRIAEITITKRRRPHMLARLRDRVPIVGELDIDDIREAAFKVIDSLIEKIEGSPFLCGEVKEWAVAIDWVLGPENFDKTMERRNERQCDGPTGSGRSYLDAGSEAVRILANRGGEHRAGGGRPHP